jgi:indole-3-pyruvate monooxygenase
MFPYLNEFEFEQGGDDVLNKDGFAKAGIWKGKNGLYCVGLSRRGFYGANLDAQNVANDIASLLGLVPQHE